MNDRWIIVPNWEKFQHYKDRRPAWIKVYLGLLDDENYLGLTPTARALLHGIWALYARHAAVLRQSSCRGALNLLPRRRHWEELSHAGFIEFTASKPASKPLPQRQRKEIDKRAEAPKTTGPAHFTIPDMLEDIAPDDVVTFASKLNDHDRGTERVLRKLRREAPFAVFADAYQALETRRRKQPTLKSEARYYVATVKKLTGEWKQEAYL